MLSKIFYFVVLIGVLIFIHELGHFLFAKWFKVKVLKFSLGFGPRLIGFRKGETEYVISWFPLGGYVKMLGEDPADEAGPEDAGRAFSDKKIYQRFLIVFAGPLFNLVLPIFIYFTYYVSQSTLPAASVGTVLVGTPAWKGGLRPGDRVVAINGEPIRYWEQVQESISEHPGDEIRISIERDGKVLPPKRITPRAVSVPRPLGLEKTVGQIGITPDYQGTRIGVSDPASPAARAGLRTWDQIVAVDGKAVRRWTELRQTLFERPGGSHRITLLRPRRVKAGYAGLYTLEPRQVVLQPDAAGSGLDAILGGLARGIEEASNALGRWVSARAEPPARDQRPEALLGKAARELGLEDAVDLTRRYLPGPGRLLSEGAGMVRRALERRPHRESPLARIAFGVADPLIDLTRVVRPRLAWPVLHSLAGLLNRHVFHGVEPAEFYVFEVQPGTPAAAIGLRRGDRVVSLNGEGLTLWREIDQARAQYPKAEFELGFVREGRLLTRRFRQEERTIIDEYKNELKRYVWGARNLGSTVFDNQVPNQDRFTRAVRRAVSKTGEVVAMMVLGIVRLVEGKISPKTVGGPLMIFDIAGKAAKKGWESFLWIMALISINLGLLNLLPIPVLDGGHLLFLGIEAIKRKPVSARAREIAGLVGLSLLILLMIFAFKNDIERYWQDIVDVFR